MATAQQPPVAPPPALTDAGGTSIGIVEIDEERELGWVAADGVVITSDLVATEVGSTATFARRDRTETFDCYVAVHAPHLALSMLRCAELDGPHLPVVTAYPTPGAAGTITYLATDNATTGTVAATSVSRNDVRFNGTTRPQYAITVRPASNTSNVDGIPPARLHGTPIISADGKVMGTVLTAPVQGGAPLSTTPRELNGEIERVKKFPDSFAAAAVLAVGKRSLVPLLVGLVAGLAWAVIARNGAVLGKVIGLATMGLLAAVGYSLLLALTVGPQTLVT